MKTKLIFDQKGIQVYESVDFEFSNDPPWKEYSIIKGHVSFSIGYEPILSVPALQVLIEDYLKERKDSLETEQVDIPKSDD